MLPKGHQLKQTQFMHDLNISNFLPQLVKLEGKFEPHKKGNLYKTVIIIYKI